MGLFASSAHAALLGADAVLGNIDTPAPFPSPPLPAFLPPVVINKAGSYPLALCCHHANVPVLVVSSDLKVRYV